MLSETTYDLLTAHPFLTGLTPKQLDRLSIWGHTTILHGGTQLFAEGGRADRFWLVGEGHVSLSTAVPGRGDIVVETLGPGSVLGWSWLSPPYRWHYSAAVLDLVHAVVLDGPGVCDLCENDPVLGYELMRRFTQVVIDRLQQTRARLLATDG